MKMEVKAEEMEMTMANNSSAHVSCRFAMRILHWRQSDYLLSRTYGDFGLGGGEGGGVGGETLGAEKGQTFLQGGEREEEREERRERESCPIWSCLPSHNFRWLLAGAGRAVYHSVSLPR